jgi:hypothetical protein
VNAVCRVLDNNPDLEGICNNSKDASFTAVSVEQCAFVAQLSEARGFCVEGLRCFISNGELKPILDVAQPSDKCDNKTGKGQCLF